MAKKQETEIELYHPLPYFKQLLQASPTALASLGLTNISTDEGYDGRTFNTTVTARINEKSVLVITLTKFRDAWDHAYKGMGIAINKKDLSEIEASKQLATQNDSEVSLPKLIWGTVKRTLRNKFQTEATLYSFLVSNTINSYKGEVTREELQRLSEMFASLIASAISQPGHIVHPQDVVQAYTNANQAPSGSALINSFTGSPDGNNSRLAPLFSGEKYLLEHG